MRAICGPGVLESLTAGSDDVYSRVSPVATPAPGVPVAMVSGLLDRLVPPYFADDYARAILKKGEASVRLADIPGAGHFDLVRLGTPAWSVVRKLIDDALRPGGGEPVDPSHPSQ